MKNNRKINEALSVFAERIQLFAREALNGFEGEIYELRIFADGPFCFYSDKGMFFVSTGGRAVREYGALSLVVTKDELKRAVNAASGFSLFAHERELNEGYLTYKGLRMGVVCSQSSFLFEGITGVVIRLPPSQALLPCRDITRLFEEKKQSVLFVGAPGSGKTTALRSVCRLLCSPETGLYKRVCVLDEHRELFEGGSVSQKCFAQVLYPNSKQEGIIRAMRYLSPDYIVCDEIADSGEVHQILQGTNAGVSFVASMHAGNGKELMLREPYRLLQQNGVFDKVIFLSQTSPGRVIKITDARELPSCGLSGY